MREQAQRVCRWTQRRHGAGWAFTLRAGPTILGTYTTQDAPTPVLAIEAREQIECHAKTMGYVITK